MYILSNRLFIAHTLPINKSLFIIHKRWHSREGRSVRGSCNANSHSASDEPSCQDAGSETRRGGTEEALGSAQRGTCTSVRVPASDILLYILLRYITDLTTFQRASGKFGFQRRLIFNLQVITFWF